MKPGKLRIEVGERVGSVSGILTGPRRPSALLVLAHGAGAGMEHPFMATVAELLFERGIATLRYQFPYMEAGRKAPDPPGVLEATVRAAVRAGERATAPKGKDAGKGKGIPLLAGGKSMGGRMTSQAAAGKGGLPGVEGLVFFGFPLHAPGKPSKDRGAHLAKVPQPMLFLQGTRDTFADAKLLRPLVRGLGRRARLHEIEGGDHSFHMKRSSGRTDAEVLAELADVVADWVARL